MTCTHCPNPVKTEGCCAVCIHDLAKFIARDYDLQTLAMTPPHQLQENIDRITLRDAVLVKMAALNIKHEELPCNKLAGWWPSIKALFLGAASIVFVGGVFWCGACLLTFWRP